MERADESVCLAARRAFTKYVDDVGLLGSTSAESYAALRSVLEQAVLALKQSRHEKAHSYRDSVAEKLKLLQQQPNPDQLRELLSCPP